MSDPEAGAELPVIVNDFTTMTPTRIVRELDRYIVGQLKAKRAVAIALRNRMRRQRLPEDIRTEIAPKNILMIGPTGVGKTEIARRLAKLCGAPFIKVEATKYTEVGYVGRDVESMIRDLMASGMSMVKVEMQAAQRADAERNAEERILDLLLPGLADSVDPIGTTQATFVRSDSASSPASREKFRNLLRSHALDQREIEITMPAGNPAIEIMSGGRNEDFEIALGSLSNMLSDKQKKKKTVTVAEAQEILLAQELEKLIDPERLADEARRRVQETGIIFIDEIDKIANREGSHSGGMDVSREGVQRDILPVIEGSIVNTKWGPIDTTHILFIAAGAFTVSKPTDLIPELQGRFPIRVELSALSREDFERILSEPKNALVKQYAQLLSTESIKLSFAPDAISRIAHIAESANSANENIGARRLHTVMERLLDEISFAAPELAGKTIVIDQKYVDERFVDFIENQDLSRYIL